MASKPGGKSPTSPRASAITSAPRSPTASTSEAIESAINSERHSSEEQPCGMVEFSDSELQDAEWPTLEPSASTANDSEEDENKEVNLHISLSRERKICKKTLPPVLTDEAKEIEAPHSDDSSEPLLSAGKDSPVQQMTERQPIKDNIQEKSRLQKRRNETDGGTIE